MWGFELKVRCKLYRNAEKIHFQMLIVFGIIISSSLLKEVWIESLKSFV